MNFLLASIQAIVALSLLSLSGCAPAVRPSSPASPISNPIIQRPEGFQKKPVIAPGLFLIASRFQMTDPRFLQSVILIVRHEKKGTIGLILNRPTKLTVGQAFPKFTQEGHLTNPVFLGGPVAPRRTFMLVRTNKKFEGGEPVLDDVAFSTGDAALQQWLGREIQKNRIRIFAGYSGWGAGQLEAEITRGGWILEPADAKTLFDMDPVELWDELTVRSTRLQATYWGGFRFSNVVAKRTPKPSGSAIVKSRRP